MIFVIYTKTNSDFSISYFGLNMNTWVLESPHINFFKMLSYFLTRRSNYIKIKICKRLNIKIIIIIYTVKNI